MQVIIAEKPSVAREIAAIVGATNSKDGFIEGNGYAVTWAFGHLVRSEGTRLNSSHYQQSRMPSSA